VAADLAHSRHQPFRTTGNSTIGTTRSAPLALQTSDLPDTIISVGNATLSTIQTFSGSAGARLCTRSERTGHRRASTQPSPTGVDVIGNLDIALAWIAISAASAKGLAVFARATVTDAAEEELGPAPSYGGRAHAGAYPTGTAVPAVAQPHMSTIATQRSGRFNIGCS
jgi:hypothetical protein